MRLEIVVACQCFSCDEARLIAREMAERLPWLQVDLTQLDGGRSAPPEVVATPTYLLDGAVIFLGNPLREALVRQIMIGASEDGPIPPGERPGHPGGTP